MYVYFLEFGIVKILVRFEVKSICMYVYMYVCMYVCMYVSYPNLDELRY